VEGRLRRHHAQGQRDHHAHAHQRRGHDQRGDEARHDQVLDRLDPAHAQGVHLLGHHHRAHLGGDAGADARGQHHAGQGGPELVHQDLDELRAHLGQVAGHAVDLQAGLEDQHHADEAEGHRHEQQRLVAHLVHLLDHLAGRPPAPEGAAHGEEEHPAQRARGLGRGQHAGAHPLDDCDQGAHRKR